jgi:uncharacterized protein YbaP (TraB family)
MAGCSGSNSTETDAPHKSFLWKVVSDSNTVYVLGSIHVASPELYPLDSTIESAFDQSQNLAVEFDIAGADQAYLTRLVMQKGMYSGGETLHDNIPEDLYKRADEVLEDLGGDIFLFNSFEPWVVALTIEELLMNEYGYTGEYGIDTHFLNMAHEEGKDIFELESAEFQIELFDDFSDELQTLLLEDAVDNPPTKKDIEEMFEAWENGDILEMEAMILEDLAGNPELKPINEKLLDERNFSMVERIVEFLQDDETYFVTVGAAHLAGENGIISLLEESGYMPVQL